MREIRRGARCALRAGHTISMLTPSWRDARRRVSFVTGRTRKPHAVSAVPIGVCAWLLMCCVCSPPAPEPSVDLQRLVLDFRPPELPDTVSEPTTPEEEEGEAEAVVESTGGISPAGVVGPAGESGGESTLLPIADAGPDQHVLSGNTVELDASGSRDATLVHFAWEQLTGPTVALSAPSSVRTSFVAPDVADGAITLEFRLTARRRPMTLGYFGMDTVVVEVSAGPDVLDPELTETVPTGAPQHADMNVRLVREIGTDRVEVETLGATVTVTPDRIEFAGTIDYTTGKITSPLQTGRLVWIEPAASFAVGSVTQRCAEIVSSQVRICVFGDSLVRIEAVTPVSYVYTSLLNAPEWVKGSGPNRMWARPRGGSLHLLDGSGSGRYAEGTDVTVDLPAGAHSGVAVFPSRPLDLSRLYGLSARPHVQFQYTAESIDRFNARPNDYFQVLDARDFGVVVLFGTLYTGLERPVVDATDGLRRYAFPDPGAIRAFVGEAHRRGLKVITYMKANYFMTQPVDETLDWMRTFQAEYDLDGWYFDNARIANTWWDNYQFMRSVRADVGADGILYHHDSVDVWGAWSGAVFVPLDAYVDYTLKGETGTLARIDAPDNPYLLYYTKGFSGNLADHKLSRESTMTKPELMHVLVELAGVKRLGGVGVLDWDAHYWNRFQEVRAGWRRN